MDQEALNKIITNLRNASALIVPIFGEDTSTAGKIERLESHLLDTARWRAVMEADRYVLEEDWEEIDDLWRNVTGFEIYLNGKPKSQEDITEAKRQVDPDLFSRRRTAIKLIGQVRKQIHRMEKDDAAVSRAYTMLTGS